MYIYAIIYIALSCTYVLIYILRRYYICTAKKPIFMRGFYPKPTGYVHVAACCISVQLGAINALSRL